ncbi:MAG TPA: DUF1549 domain-containing protein [Verrucomicrobiota bacterium]|nr:DUF1549 domain-containing protein [Verrucomicrobiota bacterium]
MNVFHPGLSRRLGELGLVAMFLWIGVGTLAADSVAGVRDDWAFQPLKHPTPPLAPAAANPIDAFLELKSTEPEKDKQLAEERRLFIRRISFDLIGLPPSPEEVAAFLSDSRPDASSRLVERLLASPHYGERWARHWLDVVRFGESQGFEYDRIRDHAWRYRDYVINALNADKPYDQFVREQLAGDVLEPITQDGMIATGFLVAGPWDQAGNSSASSSTKAMVREAELEDIVGTVGQTFLGVTLNCARCHQHKFDPIPQRDYYRVKAVFQGVRHGDRSILTPPEIQARADATATNARDLAEVEGRLAELDRRVRERVAASSGRSEVTVTPPQPFARWSFDGDAQDSQGHLPGTPHGGARIEGGRLHLDGQQAFVETAPLDRALQDKTLEAWVYLTSATPRGGGVITVETADGKRFDSITFGERQPRKWMAGSDSTRRSRDLEAAEESALPGEPVHVAIVYGSDRKISVFRNGRPYGEPYIASEDSGIADAFPVGSRVVLGRRSLGANTFFGGEIEEARLYDRALSTNEIAASYRAGPPTALVTPDELRAALTPAEQTQRQNWLDQRERLLAWPSRQSAAPIAYIANPEQPGPTLVLLRGEPDKPRDPVTPGTLSAVQTPDPELGLSAESAEAERRRRFANWVTSPANPLTARVIVNRVWQHHFGRGLVGTPNDFGKMGERPSHPELLDWLAGWFVSPEGGNWSLKRLHRLMVTSEAYQRVSKLSPPPAGPDRLSSSSVPSAHAESVSDPTGQISPRRLDAEELRDALLALSGELNSEMGGPGFRPFTHKGNGGQNEYFAADLLGAEFNRRTIYRICVHSARDPLLDALDCPEFSTRTPVRPNTTTPLQALSLMNNSFVQRQATKLADRVASEAGPRLEAQVNRLWQYVLSRAPTVSERTNATGLARTQGLSSVAWALLNSNEFIFVR